MGDSHYTFTSALTTWQPVVVKVWHGIQADTFTTALELGSLWPESELYDRRVR